MKTRRRQAPRRGPAWNRKTIWLLSRYLDQVRYWGFRLPEGRVMIGRRISCMLTAIVLIASLGGCNSIKDQRLNTALEASVKTYEKLMRWGRYEEAAQYFLPKDESVRNSDIRRLAYFRVTSYEILSQLIADTKTDARVIAHIEFYGIDTGIVKSYRDEQFWWYDEQSERWYLGSPMPDFDAQVKR